jgi:hypothetical protein
MDDRSDGAVAQGATWSKLVDLDRSQCLDLLRGTVIGRVVFTDSALPAAQPVTYLLDGEEIVFRTGQGTKLAARMPEPWIPASVAHVIAVPLSRLSGRRAGPAS